MLDNLEVENMVNNNWFTASVLDGNDLWFVPELGAKLLHCNIESSEIEFCGNIPNEDQLLYGNYAGMVKVENYLILAPSMGKELAVYDIAHKSFHKVPVDNPNKIDDKFIWGVAVGEKAFFIGFRYPAILEFNVRTMQCVIHSFEDIEEIYCQKKGTIFFEESYCVVNDSLMLPCCNNGYVLEFHMQSKNFTLHLIGEDIHLRTISYDGTYCWISIQEKEGFIRWNPETKETRKELLKDCRSTDDKSRKYYTCSVKNEIYVFPYASDTFYKGKGDTLEEVDLGEELHRIAQAPSVDADHKKLHFLNKSEDDRLFVYSVQNNKVYIFDTNKNAVQSIELNIPKKIIREFSNADMEAWNQKRNTAGLLLNEKDIYGGVGEYLWYIIQ